MSPVVEYYKRQYQSGNVTKEQLKAMVNVSQITQKEYDYMTKEE